MNTMIVSAAGGQHLVNDEGFLSRVQVNYIAEESESHPFE